MVLIRREGDVARVQLDYVTPRFRDFSPGEFVWRRAPRLRERGFRRVVTPPGHGRTPTTTGSTRTSVARVPSYVLDL